MPLADETDAPPSNEGAVQDEVETENASGEQGTASPAVTMVTTQVPAILRMRRATPTIIPSEESTSEQSAAQGEEDPAAETEPRTEEDAAARDDIASNEEAGAAQNGDDQTADEEAAPDIAASEPMTETPTGVVLPPVAEEEPQDGDTEAASGETDSAPTPIEEPEATLEATPQPSPPKSSVFTPTHIPTSTMTPTSTNTPTQTTSPLPLLPTVTPTPVPPTDAPAEETTSDSP